MIHLESFHPVDWRNHDACPATRDVKTPRYLLLFRVEGAAAARFRSTEKVRGIGDFDLLVGWLTLVQMRVARVENPTEAAGFVRDVLSVEGRSSALTDRPQKVSAHSLDARVSQAGVDRLAPAKQYSLQSLTSSPLLHVRATLRERGIFRWTIHV